MKMRQSNECLILVNLFLCWELYAVDKIGCRTIWFRSHNLLTNGCVGRFRVVRIRIEYYLSRGFDQIYNDNLSL